jgi:hypothetical protein
MRNNRGGPMRGRGRWMAAALVTLGLGVTGCSIGSGSTTAGTGKAVPAKVEVIPGKDVKRVTLTEQAHRRLGIETVTIGTAPAPAQPAPVQPAPVQPAPAPSPSGGAATIVPYRAVLYAADGGTWVYTVTQPLTYVREKVVLANVGATEALLALGPPAGATVVSTGVIELYGAELGVGK